MTIFATANGNYAVIIISIAATIFIAEFSQFFPSGIPVGALSSFGIPASLADTLFI
jgi:hypothetical protein